MSLPFIDPWASRCGIALALGKIAPHLSDREIDSVFSFFVHYGLSDRVEKVRSLMLDAGLSALNIHGKVTHSCLFTSVISSLKLL